MKLQYVSLVALAVLVSGCNSNTQIKTAIKEDRQAALGRCMRIVDFEGPGVKSQLKSLTGASDQRLSAVVCERLIRGVESGRITRDDFRRAGRGQGTPIFKLLKGR